MLIHAVQCDSCGFQEDHRKTTRDWLTVDTVVSGQERFQELFQRAEDGEKDYASGWFCQMKCLSNWAFAQVSMAALSEPEPEDEPGLD